ncbi:hypothetical protein CYY_001093 [Polysphondylium violaceum]|uniref:Uncharacterized protein n=1 Tax=Polysphondylium violaceum TaxID=133409 RepID=A0A8J4Q1P0_9MYCE|nr:hypothetical protein CYY_001093 [Polysphondylium violaceum]
MVNVCILTSGQEDSIEVKKTFDQDGFQFELKSEPELDFNYYESVKDNYLLFIVYSSDISKLTKSVSSFFQEKKDIELDMQFMTVAASKQSDAQEIKTSFYEYKSGLLLAPMFN